MKLLKVGVVVLLVVAGLVAGHVALRRNSPLYNLVFPPDDLGDIRVDTPFDLSEKGQTKDLVATHVYPGSYWVTLEVEHPMTDVHDGYRSDFVVQITVTRGDEEVLDRTVSGPGPWFFGARGHRGFALLIYDVPGTLPRDVPLTFRARVVEASPGFSGRYGRQRLVISKASDE